MSAETVWRLNIAAPELEHFPDLPESFRFGIATLARFPELTS